MPLKRAGPHPASSLRILALTLLVVLAAGFAGWSFFWHAAARQTDAVLTSWIAEEGALGRSWTCPDRRVAGYPFDIEVSCANLAFRGEILASRFAGSLRGFHAASSVLRPDRIIARIEPPFAGETRDGKMNFTLDWAKLDLTIDGGPEALTRLALDGEQVSLKGSIVGLWALNSQARSVQASVRPRPGDDQPLFDFKIAINGAAAPALSDRLGLTAPLDAVVGGTITKLDISDSGTLSERIERWRTAGGRVDVNELRLTSGDAKLEARGALDLDEERRPHGKLDTAFEGLDPLFGRLGVDPKLLAAGALLTSLLVDRSGNANEQGGANATRLTLRAANGWLAIGPIQTPLRLPPLY